MTEDFPKKQTISLDIDRLIKRALEGDNLTILFETELQKKLIDPVFKKVTEEASKTEINLSNVDLNGIFTKVIADIKLDPNVISNLNTAFSDKINSLTTSINGVSIDNIRRDFEQNFLSSLKDKFKEIKIQSPKQIETKDLLYFLTGGAIKLDYVSAYKIGEATVNLVDKLTDGLKSIKLDINSNLDLKDVVKLLINPKQVVSRDIQSRYESTVNKFLNIIEKDIESFKLQDLKPLTHKDIINILFDTKPANAAEMRKEYEEIINSLSAALEAVSDSYPESITSSLKGIPKPTTSAKLDNKVDNLADYDSDLEDAVFTSKELTLSSDTLKKLKEDSLSSYKEGDLATNSTAINNTAKIVDALNSLSEKIEDASCCDSTSSGSLLDVIKAIAAGLLGARASRNRTPSNRTPSNRTPSNRTPSNRTPGNRTPSNRTPSNRTPSNRTPSNRTPSNRTPSRGSQSTPPGTKPVARPRAATRPQPPPRTRPSTASRSTSRSGQNPSQRTSANRPQSTPRGTPSASVTRVGNTLTKMSKAAGVLGTVATIGVGAYNYNVVDTATKAGQISKEEGTREKSKIVGETTGILVGGAAGGAAAGALAGLAGGPFAPITVPVAAIVGGILGSIGGEMIGNKAGEKIADKFLIPEEAKKLSPSIEERIYEKPVDKVLIPEEAKKLSSSIEERIYEKATNISTSPDASEQAKKVPTGIGKAAEQLLEDSKKPASTPVPAADTPPAQSPQKGILDSLTSVASTDSLRSKISPSERSAESAKMYAESVSTLSFTPLISFLDKKFEDLGLNLILLHKTLLTNNNQSSINIINNEGEQVVENTNTGYDSSPEPNGYNTIEDVRQAYRLLS